MPYEDPLKEYFKQNPEKKLKLFKIYTKVYKLFCKRFSNTRKNTKDRKGKSRRNGIMQKFRKE